VNDNERRRPQTETADWIVAAFNRHERPLLRYAAWLLDDVDRARDIVQETFLRLCRERPESVDDHLPQWLFTVCRNLAIDAQRKSGRTESLGGVVDILNAPDVEKALEAFERQELLVQILRIVETLPKNQREVVHLRFEGGLSYKQISAVTGLSVGNVGFLIHSAMAGIRRRITASPATSRREVP
jgi:RNA polymerase sigma-70 factor (ECF subfamily)